MEPEVLVLDEPTAGLDPRGRREIMDMFYRIHQEKGLSTILVTHSMEDAAHYADDIVILNQGQVKRKGKPREIFSSAKELVALGLNVPDVVHFQYMVEQKLGRKLRKTCLTIEELAEELKLTEFRGDPS
jgi:energy-coupling factor transport system ATP-binding protein